MTLLKLFKSRTAAVQLVYILAACGVMLGSGEVASANQLTPPVMGQPKVTDQVRRDNQNMNINIQTASTTPGSPGAGQQQQVPIYASPPVNTCSANISKISDAKARADSACNGNMTCVREALKCDVADQTVGGYMLEDYDDDEQDCEALVGMGCAAMNESSIKDQEEDRKSSREERKDLQKEKDDLAQQAVDRQKQTQESLNEIEKEMIQLRRDKRDETKKIMDDMQKNQSEAENAKMEALNKTREQFDQLDVQYIEMREQLRQLQAKVNNAELRWKVTCWEYAEGASKQMQKDLDTRMRAEEATRRNMAARSAQGYKKRVTKKNRKKLADTFNEELTKCRKGEIAPGSTWKMDVDQMKLEFFNAEASAADRAARLENLRKQMIEQMQQLTQMLDKRHQQAVKDAQELLANLESDSNENVAQLQKRAGEIQQQAQQQEMLDMQKLARTHEDLQAASKQQTVASARLKCMRNGNGATSRANIDEVKEARRELLSVAASCNQLLHDCNSKERGEMGKTCEEIRGLARKYREAGTAAASGAGSGSSTGGSSGSGARQ